MTALAVERNLGFVTEEEQEILAGATVAIAGAGGDGGMLAIQLARMGIGMESAGGEIRLADPDTFEEENLNRQAACTSHTVGQNKALAVGEYIQDINSGIRVRAFTEGITLENVEDFVSGADLLIDETEFTLHSIGTALARAARKEGIPNLQVMNVGFGAQVTSYDPKSKHTFERRLGLDETMPLEEVAATEVGIDHWLAHLPAKYADLATFEKVASGEKSAPSVAPGVAIAAGMGASQAILHLLRGQNHRAKPVTFPNTLVFDGMTGEQHNRRHPRVGFYRSLASMVLRNRLHLNPRASY